MSYGEWPHAVCSLQLNSIINNIFFPFMTLNVNRSALFDDGNARVCSAVNWRHSVFLAKKIGVHSLPQNQIGSEQATEQQVHIN
jgi:hypothetical protein